MNDSKTSRDFFKDEILWRLGQAYSMELLRLLIAFISAWQRNGLKRAMKTKTNLGRNWKTSINTMALNNICAALSVITGFSALAHSACKWGRVDVRHSICISNRALWRSSWLGVSKAISGVVCHLCIGWSDAWTPNLATNFVAPMWG